MIDVVKKELINFFRNSKEQLIKKALAKNNINPDNLEDLTLNCRIEIYPDRSETYFYKNVPILTIKEEKIVYPYNTTDFKHVVDYDILYLEH